MIILPIDESIPDDAKGSAIVDGELHVYFADDPEVIAESLIRAKMEKQINIMQNYTAQESVLQVNKNDYRDMMAASIADIGHGGKTQAETRREFKTAVIARQEIQNSRESLINKVIAAQTIEELEEIDISGNI